MITRAKSLSILIQFFDPIKKYIYMYIYNNIIILSKAWTRRKTLVHCRSFAALIGHNWSGWEDRRASTRQSRHKFRINRAGIPCFGDRLVLHATRQHAYSTVSILFSRPLFSSTRPRRSREEFEIFERGEGHFFGRERLRANTTLSSFALKLALLSSPKWKNVVIFEPTKSHSSYGCVWIFGGSTFVIRSIVRRRLLRIRDFSGLSASRILLRFRVQSISLSRFRGWKLFFLFLFLFFM